MSLLHLVSFKYKADAGAPARDDHRARLAALKDIDGIASLMVGWESAVDFEI